MRWNGGLLVACLLLGAGDARGVEGQEWAPGTFEVGLMRTERMQIPDGRVSLYNLNPAINKWFVLEIKKKRKYRIHLDNADPMNEITLTDTGLMFTRRDQSEMRRSCSLWNNPIFRLLDINFRERRNPYFPLCEGLVYIRLRRSSETKLSMTEWTTEMLRKTSFGEDVISAIKPMVVAQGAESGATHILTDNFSSAHEDHDREGFPRQPLADSFESHALLALDNNLGIAVNVPDEELSYGRWYQSSMHAGIYTSLYIPRLIPPSIRETGQDRVFPLEQENEDKLIYLVAYDLSRYEIRYVVGTEQPPLSTSQPHYGRQAKLRRSLIAVGSIPPYELQNAVGVFIGGFKHEHGKILAGPLKGRAYGYIENGVELAPMSAGLATAVGYRDGSVDLMVWPAEPEQVALLRSRVVSARQNGTMLVEDGQPGAYVNKWRWGNWSASAKGLRRSLRSGICLQKNPDRDFLIFMAFTSATPSTMARSMQAYGCDSGIHLDMNAYMYLHNAIYRVGEDNAVTVEYLNSKMLYPPTLKRHRFIMDNNRRDFFYVKKRPQR